jgi:DNA-binding protein Fis
MAGVRAHLDQPTPSPQVAMDDGRIVLHSVNLKDAEAVLIQKALEQTGQNRTRAAELLGVSVRTLRNKLNG